MRTVIAIAALALAARCAPVTASASLNRTPEDAAACATSALQSLGYAVIDANVADGVRAERDLHPANPFTGAADADRITVWFRNGEQPQIRVLGETVHTPGVWRGPLGRRGFVSAPALPMRTIPSRSVRGDVETIATSCSS